MLGRYLSLLPKIIWVCCLKEKKKSMQGALILVTGYWISTLVRLLYNPCLSTLWIHPAVPPPSLYISKPLGESVKEERRVTYPTVSGSQSCAAHMNHLAWLTWSPSLIEGFPFLWVSTAVKEPNNRGAHSSPYILGQGKLDGGGAAVPANLPAWTMLLSEERSQVEHTSQSSRDTMLLDDQTTLSSEKPVLLSCGKKRMWKHWLCPLPFSGSKTTNHKTKLPTRVKNYPFLFSHSITDSQCQWLTPLSVNQDLMWTKPWNGLIKEPGQNGHKMDLGIGLKKHRYFMPSLQSKFLASYSYVSISVFISKEISSSPCIF